MRFSVLAIIFLLAASPADAHYQMLLPNKSSVKKGDKITLVYQWGHPFEHQLFDAPKPTALVVIPVGGKPIDLLPKVEAIEVDAGKKKKVKAWRVHYTPEERGDYIFILQAAPIFLEEEGIFVEDLVKTVVHVEVQKGWDATNERFEFDPLTRPYGLQPGLVFQARLLARKRGDFAGLAGVPVEVEHYNDTPPRTLPPDEQITRVVKTDDNGVVTCTLPDAGWWCLTGALSGGMRDHEGKPHPVKQRTTFWVFIDA